MGPRLFQRNLGPRLVKYDSIWPELEDSRPSFIGCKILNRGLDTDNGQKPLMYVNGPQMFGGEG